MTGILRWLGSMWSPEFTRNANGDEIHQPRDRRWHWVDSANAPYCDQCRNRLAKADRAGYLGR